MIQFNLLPDVKLEYIKANRLKRTVTVISIFAAAAGLLILILLFFAVDVVQKSHMNNLNNQISTLTTKLKNIPNLNQVLTVQKEVNAVPSLHAQKPVVTRLSGYISELTPSSATISDLNTNFGTNIVVVTGSANSLATVNQFVDTLKLSSYQTSTNVSPKNAFSNVILTSFNYASSTGATYTITASFDPTIFSGSYPTVTLNVPSGSSSNHSSSNTTQSGTLFQPQPSTPTNSSTNSTTGQ